MIEVTGVVSEVVVVVHAWPRAPSVGSPAEPRHSYTVTTAEPPLAVTVLTMVIWQMMPSPPALPMSVEHAPTALSGAADTGSVVMRDTGASSAKAARLRKRTVTGERI
jgi:hypothetical protein